MERQNRAFPPSSIPSSLDKPSYLPEDVIIILSFSRVNSLNSFNLSLSVTLLSHQDLLRNWDWRSPVGPSVSPPDPILQGMWGCTRSTTGPSAADTVSLPEAHKSPPFHRIWGDSPQDCPFLASSEPTSPSCGSCDRFRALCSERKFIPPG